MLYVLHVTGLRQGSEAHTQSGWSDSVLFVQLYVGGRSLLRQSFLKNTHGHICAQYYFRLLYNRLYSNQPLEPRSIVATAKKRGAAIKRLSILSNMPPWPGSSEPESCMHRDRTPTITYNILNDHRASARSLHHAMAVEHVRRCCNVVSP